MSKSMQLYNTQVVPATTAARVGLAAVRLMKVVLYPAAANSICEFKNAATDTGDVLLTVSAIANGHSVEVDFTSVGGLLFSTGMFCKPAGTGSIAYVWYA